MLFCVKMYSFCVVLLLLTPIFHHGFAEKLEATCTCGVFLSGQLTAGNSKPPAGYPPILTIPDETFACSSTGVKHCTTKCLENLVSHLPTSPGVICGSIDRDVFKERAFLFVKNCDSTWINTRMSAGREYCCKNSVFYKCPNVAS